MVYIKLVFGFLCQSFSSFGLGKSRRLEKLILWRGLNLNSVEWFFSYLVVWERKGAYGFFGFVL